MLDRKEAEIPPVDKEPEPPGPFDRLKKAVRHPSFLLAMAAVVGAVLMHWPLVRTLPGIWLGQDGYYSHGFLVPLLIGYVILRWWPNLEKLPVKPGWAAVPFVLASVYVAFIANRTDIDLLQSVSLVGSIWVGIWFVAGIRWMWALFWPTAYALFALPIWTMAIDTYTNPLQRISTDVAEQVLQVSGYDPIRLSATEMAVGLFPMDIDVPCSGFKLLLAVTAFIAFFVMVGRMRWWANLTMVGVAIPLCLFVNGLRIALIGMVGDERGTEAGLAFHDASGYITLVLCFFVFFKLARVLGWKD